VERVAQVGTDRESPATGVPVVEDVLPVGGAVRPHVDLPGVVGWAVRQGGERLIHQLLDPLAGRHVAVAELVGHDQPGLGPAHQQRLLPPKPLIRPQRALLRRLDQMGVDG
jgi:hypothetical protein